MKKISKSAKGQILILYLLILVIGMAVVLSVASRVITDIQITTTSDESNRAYFAAEAGIEEALRRLQLDPDLSGSVDLSFVSNRTEAETTITNSCTSPPCQVFVYPERLEQDEVAQIAFLDNFSDLSSPSSVPSHINFYWGNTGNAPGVEISIVYYGGGNFYIRKIGLDRFGRGGFCTNATPGSWSRTDSFTGRQETMSFRATIDRIDGSPPSCGTFGTRSEKPVMARVRMMHNADPSPLAVEVTSGSLPVQGAIVESSGNTLSGVTRKVQAFKLHAAVPPFLDYVLFSGDTGTAPIRK